MDLLSNVSHAFSPAGQLRASVMLVHGSIVSALSACIIVGCAFAFGKNQKMLSNGDGEVLSDREFYALKLCNFFVGKQEKATKPVEVSAKGAINLASQGVGEATERLQQESYELHAAKFQQEETSEETKTLVGNMVGGSEVAKKVEQNITAVENKVACGVAYGYKQAAAHTILPAATKAVDYFIEPKELSKPQDAGLLQGFGNAAVEGGQVKLKQGVADWVEEKVNLGANWAGHTTTRALKGALVDTLVLHLGNHPLVKGGACAAEILTADSFSDGAARLLSVGVRELCGSTTLSSAAYVGGRLGMLAGELLIRSYQNRLMLKMEEISKEGSQNKGAVLSDKEIKEMVESCMPKVKPETEEEKTARLERMEKEEKEDLEMENLIDECFPSGLDQILNDALEDFEADEELEKQRL